ncbi:para-aminobenzoate synthase [Geminocystis sp. NIES-3708]|uniref:aminodeoxychorismate synthase n=1 Tax=Geminocystis sp. NIES-3708 TaxID=1615909 RepID=UPI0005FC4869|nr:aminodeoxychorismate synthase [Geminocystis sp. NIES-3708]BAQ60538.1 para-aminobenzoate synthase [Geminocystis sp. NIES-3708]
MKSLIIDNYDSFTYNIYQLLAEVNQKKPIVITNNELSWQEIKELNIDNIIISPGPGHPENINDFGVCGEVLLKANIPVLGICLGHQGLGYFYGAKINKSPQPFHGRISKIYHHQHTIFQSIPSPFSVMRYHSLIIENSLSDDLEVIAKTDDNLVMGIKHKYKPLWGVQFHPESIASEYGKELLINFHNLTKSYYKSVNKIDYLSSSLQNKSNNKQYEINEKNQLNNLKISNNNYQVYSRKIDIFIDSALVFEKIYSQSNHSFWLDSSMIAQGLSRFSYMGDSEGDNSFLVEYNVNNQQIKITQNNNIDIFTVDIFKFLQDTLDIYSFDNPDLPFNFNGGFIGYFGYELKGLLGNKNKHQSFLPDANFIFCDRLIIFDHICQEIYLIFVDKVNQENKAGQWFKETENKLKLISKNKDIIHGNKIPNNQNNKKQKYSYKLSRDKREYLDNINTCLEKIKQGESYEICLTNHLYLPTISEPLNFYLKLRKENPAPYSAFLKFDKIAIICSSPERFLLLEKDGNLESKPIKGTVKRGNNKEEDIHLKNSLKKSEKEKAENLMIVDLLRNDLGRVCEIATVTVPKLMAIETYATLHQMVSTVKGKIREEVKPVDCIKACFPGGSMTGTPKKRTLEIIDELETESRGIYSGSIGFLALNGTMDLNIVIRTAIITPEQTSIGVGGAITILSQPDKEFEEIILKAKALIDSL